MMKKLFDAILPRRTTARKHKVRSVSVVICTRNRAHKLSRCLAHIDQAARPSGVNLEVVIVDNGSEDNTREVFNNFDSRTTLPATFLEANRIGLGYARNCGIRGSTGDLIVLTDDDCYVDEMYFLNLVSSFDPIRYQYGGGQILLFNSDDDPRVAKREIPKSHPIPRMTPVVRPGIIQGANMFFLRNVFDEAGFFNEDMGAGTEFPCEDIEMACRASRKGFVGIMLSSLIVYHDHGRKFNSEEALKVIQGYAFGRGAYYASLVTDCAPEVWKFWLESLTRNGEVEPNNFDRLSRELMGASRYMSLLSEKHRNDLEAEPKRVD